MNGKKNGKGVEYEKYSNIKYAGEFLNGKKNGKIKEYDYSFDLNFNLYKNDILIFEGEYLNNYRSKGKEYFGKLLFEGEYLFSKNGIEKNMIIMEIHNLN